MSTINIVRMGYDWENKKKVKLYGVTLNIRGKRGNGDLIPYRTALCAIWFNGRLVYLVGDITGNGLADAGRHDDYE